MKRKIIFGIAVATCLLGAAWLFFWPSSLSFPIEHITRIELWDGSNGNMVEFTDPAQIQTIIDPFNENRFRRTVRPPIARAGWSYRLRIFQGEETVADIVFLSGERFIIGAFYYNIPRNVIDLDFYRELLSN